MSQALSRFHRAVGCIVSAALFAAPLIWVPATAQPARADQAAQLSGAESTVGGTGPLANELNADTEHRIQRGLEWLAHHQQPDGSWPDAIDNVAITALAGIAFLAQGSTPGEGPYGSNVQKALECILRNCQPSGLIASQAYGSPMYGHGFATLFLAECYGEAPRDEVKEKLQNAVRLLVQTQNREGGWRYQPAPNDADISVTICEVMALRAARNAGIKVPKITIDRAIAYVKRLQQADGGFAYQAGQSGSAFPRSAAGVALLYYAGVYSGKEITNGLRYLLQRLPGQNNMNEQYHYYYGIYYATQATFMAGGEAWAKFWPAVRRDVERRQQDDGSWPQIEAGQSYATAMSLIVLQIPNRLLPVLQR